MPLTLVAAVADNGVIGADGGIPWRIAEDFAHFKALTLGHVLVMGRATFESIGRPLPGRITIVLTRDPAWSADGVLVAPDLASAVRLAETIDSEVFVVGGASVYAEALALADAQVLTEVHLSPAGDTRYPQFDRGQWDEARREPHLDAEIPYEFVWWERV
ncbi:MAG TPA: dihydrofolate reductase [Marmoricola sp.]|jgi:dihydrofolate reductase|nr:dihydrofolate reductase [Marmoricola sp.]